MPLWIREDVAYILLEKINESGQECAELNFNASTL